jgi:hypothetical protein
LQRGRGPGVKQITCIEGLTALAELIVRVLG